MANYPTSLDSFTNPSSVDSLSAPSHSLQHADANDAIEALEAKLGIGNSPAGSATAGRVLVAGTGGSTSWTTVSAGAISTTGGSAGQVLTAGTAGVAEWAYSGLTLIKTQTIGSAVSSVTVTNAFSATYDNYRIVISGGVSSATPNLALTLGSTNTGYYYSYVYVDYTVSTVYGQNGQNQSSWIRVARATSNSIYGIFDISNPFTTKNTIFTSTGAGAGTNDFMFNGGGYLANTTSYTDFTLTTSSGTLTGGTIYVYGYRNS